MIIGPPPKFHGTWDILESDRSWSQRDILASDTGDILLEQPDAGRRRP